MQSGTYTITVKGRIPERWLSWFEGLSVIYRDDGNTDLQGLIIDQAALFGYLAKLRNLALELVAVMPASTQSTHSDFHKQPTIGGKLN